MSKVTIKLNAPTHHGLEAIDPADGGAVRLHGGGTAEVSEQLAVELATANYCDVEILDELDVDEVELDEPTDPPLPPPDLGISESGRRQPLLDHLSQRDAGAAGEPKQPEADGEGLSEDNEEDS